MSERHISLKEKVIRAGLTLTTLLGLNVARTHAQSLINGTVTDLPNGHILFATENNQYLYFAAHNIAHDNGTCPECDAFYEGTSFRIDMDPQTFDSIYITGMNGEAVSLQDKSATWNQRGSVWHSVDVTAGIDSSHTFTWNWKPFLDGHFGSTNPDMVAVDISLSPGVTTDCPTHKVLTNDPSAVNLPNTCHLTTTDGGTHTATLDWTEVFQGTIVESGSQVYTWNTDSKLYIPLVVR